MGNHQGPQEAGPSPGDRPAGASGRREELLRLLQIFGLAGFVFAQPVLDVFGKSPETFIFRGAGRLEIVLFAVVIAVVPALGIWLLGLLSGLFGSAARRATHAATVWGLASLVGIQVLKKSTPLLGLPLALAGAAFGGIVLLAFTRWRPARAWFTYSAVAPVAFVLIFLILSSVSKLVLPAPASRVPVVATAARVPVVMVVLDELPLLSLLDDKRRINDELYPNFSRLAGESTWFRNYTVTENTTHFSIPTILTGRVVTDRSTSPVAADFPDTLFSLLSRTHRVTAMEWYTDLCTADVCSEPAAESSHHEPILPALMGDAASIWTDLSLPGEVTRDIMEQFDVEDEAAELEDEEAGVAGKFPGSIRTGRVRMQERDTPESKLRPDTFERFLDSLHRGGRRPVFSFIHTHPPHSPWVLFPSGVRYRNMPRPLVTGVRPNQWVDEEWPVSLIRSRHILQVQFADRLVGELIRRLEETGLYDEALLVVTSDHGMSFIPGGPLRAFTNENLHEVASVPLFVKVPGQRDGVVDDGNLSSPDLLPTIADVLGFEIPWETDGASMLDPEVDWGPTKAITRHRNLPNFPWPDETFQIDVRSLERRLRKDSFRPADPSADPSLWPYLIGPGAHLVGRAVEELQVVEPAGALATIESPLDVAQVDLSEGFLTALVAGRVSGVDAGNTLVAVALNGRVAGVSPTFSRDGSGGAFEVLIPDHFFRQGRNDFRLYLVEGSVLRPLATA
jgi:hypothetical protein